MQVTGKAKAQEGLEVDKDALGCRTGLGEILGASLSPAQERVKLQGWGEMGRRARA